MKNQITKSGTSVGANYREANRSRNKIKICESEASETVYWLEIIQYMNWEDSLIIEPVIKEANEILALFTSIGKKLKL
ncbi:MAG: four helix bundle protein [Maribacter sp.]